MTQLQLPDPAQLTRKLDPVTSVLAAAKVAKASSEAIRTLAEFLAHSRYVFFNGFTDEEAWRELRLGANYKKSQATIRHARKSLADAGLLKDTGETRPTSDGGQSRVWSAADIDGLRRVAAVDAAKAIGVTP